MRKLLFCIIFLCVYPCTAQDELVTFEDLTFFSEIEKQVFTNYVRKGEYEAFMLFMANGHLLKEKAVYEARNRFYTHLQAFDNDKFRARKNDKKAKAIYDDLHRNFLKKYENGSSLESVFYNGDYNSLTAAALCGLAFEKLGIPFAVREDPNEIYLVAYPQTERIKIEAASPAGGVQVVNPAFKQQFVKALKDYKRISQQEYLSQSVDHLFDKYYFGSQQYLTLVNLAGIHYFHDGNLKLEQALAEEASAQFEKSYLLYPSEKTRYLLFIAYSTAFEKRGKKDHVHATYLSKLSRMKDYGVTGDMVQGEFMRVVQELLFNQGNKAQLNDYFQTLDTSLVDIGLKQEIRFLYHYENGRLLYNQARYKEALAYFERALTLKPQHADVNSAVVSSLSQVLSKLPDNLEAIHQLESYAARYSSLAEHNVFNTMLASVYLMQANMEYNAGKPLAGEKYRLLFEEHSKKHPAMSVSSVLIAQSYSAAAVYYYRKGNTTRAKSIIQQGLEFSPNNYELMARLQMMK